MDLFFIHAISGINEMTPAIKTWAAEMKKAGKMKFFGFSTHTNMEDCLLGAAKLDWIDAVMFTYNFRVMHSVKMKEAVNACEKSGVGLVAMKSMAGGPGAAKIASEAKLDMAERFLKRGFTDKQAKLKIIWENPQIASICVQMPNLTILSANVAAARDQVKLAKEEFDSLRQYALETQAGYCAGCGHLCQEAVGGAVPVNEVMRGLMYHRYYGEPELARMTFAALGEEVKQQLTAVDYSRAEQVCPQRLAIAAPHAPGRGGVGLALVRDGCWSYREVIVLSGRAAARTASEAGSAPPAPGDFSRPGHPEKLRHEARSGSRPVN